MSFLSICWVPWPLVLLSHLEYPFQELWRNTNVLVRIILGFFTIDLKLFYSCFFNKKMSYMLLNVRLIRKVFNKFWELIRIGIINIVVYPEKLLIIIVRTCWEDSCNTNNVGLGKPGNITIIFLMNKIIIK